MTHRIKYERVFDNAHVLNSENTENILTENFTKINETVIILRSVFMNHYSPGVINHCRLSDRRNIKIYTI